MIENYETVEGCLTRQPIQQVLVGVPALQLYCMQLSNAWPINSTQILTSSWKIWKSENVGAKMKKLSNWFRWYHSFDLGKIQLEVDGKAGETLVFFQFFFKLMFFEELLIFYIE